MIEPVVIFCFLMVTLLACGLGLALVVVVKNQHNAIARVIAQSDEHVKVHASYSEKAINRYMAAATPETFKSMRQNSGLVDGAQAAVKPHYEADERPRHRKVTVERGADGRPTNGAAYRPAANVTTLGADDFEEGP